MEASIPTTNDKPSGSADALNYVLKQDRGERETKVKLGLWATLSTMKFAIWILILLGALSLVAMFVGEFHDPRMMQQPTDSYSQQIVRGLINVFQMDDAYRSWWYRLLLGVLCLSLFACILKRLPMVWRIWNSPPPDFRLIQQAPGTIHRSSELPKEDLLRRLGSSWSFRKKQDDVWVGEKRRLGMWGPLTTHIGMLLLGIGSLVISFGTFTTRLGGYAGDTLALNGMPFTVQIDSFRVYYYPLQPLQLVLVDNAWLGELVKTDAQGNWIVERWMNNEIVQVTVEANRIRNRFDNDRDRGNIQKFSSFVKVYEDGELVDQREIAVNAPLRRAGFRFYQSSYDTENPRVEAGYDSIEISLTDSAANVYHTIYLKPGVEVKIPGDTISVKAGRLVPDFKIGHNNMIFSGNESFINPGLELEYSGEAGYRSTKWLLKNLPMNNVIGRYNYSITRFFGENSRWEMATIFEVKHTYGTSILWMGFLIASIGLLLAFYVIHRMLYLIWPAEGRTSTFIIGVSRKMPLEFENDIDRLLRRK